MMTETWRPLMLMLMFPLWWIQTGCYYSSDLSSSHYDRCRSALKMFIVDVSSSILEEDERWLIEDGYRNISESMVKEFLLENIQGYEQVIRSVWVERKAENWVVDQHFKNVEQIILVAAIKFYDESEKLIAFTYHNTTINDPKVIKKSLDGMLKIYDSSENKN